VDATALYRRRQRRRAVIAWSTLGVIVAIVVLAIVFGGEDKGSGPGSMVRIFTSEMSSSQYEQLHKGEAGLAVFKEVGSTGVPEGEFEEPEVLRMFPPPPRESSCSFWTLSDAPDHHVRLCFSTAEGVLLQKVVRAPDESTAETTLA
jgi:hypothetical protein